jgi:acyl-lipid omega-6 desaturase (Delta-12 desaturase)
MNATDAATATKSFPSERRQLRAALANYAEKRTTTAMAWVIFDYALFLMGVLLVILPTAYTLKVLASLLIWAQIARLFIIGHDACHQALTAHRRLNRVVGRLVFLPSLTPYSLWEVGHNLAHHGFSNLRGKDNVWVPFSPDEFVKLPRLRQWLERIYRSGYGHWLYYLVELWWKKLYFPSANEVGSARPVFKRDSILVTLFAVAWVGSLVVGALHFGQSITAAVLLGFALPFLLWNGLMGFVIYVHHTDPAVAWYANADAWAKSHPYLSATVHIDLPFALGAVLHNIMEHPAHHLDMTIPFYNLSRAQEALAKLAAGRIEKRTFSWAWYWQCVKVCKTYDYVALAWQPFPQR